MASVHVVQLYLNISFICYCWWSTRGNCSRRYIARLQNGRETFSGDMWSEIDARSSCIAICRLPLSQRLAKIKDLEVFVCFSATKRGPELIPLLPTSWLSWPPSGVPFTSTLSRYNSLVLWNDTQVGNEYNVLVNKHYDLVTNSYVFEWEESFILRLDGKVALGEYKLNSPYRWAYKVYWFKLQKFQGSSETSSVFPFLAATDIEDAMNKGKGKSRYHYTWREWF